MLNKKSTAGAKADSEQKAEVTTSSPNTGNTHVVRSPLFSEPYIATKIQEIFITGNILKVHFVNDKSFLQIQTSLLSAIISEKLKTLNGITVQIFP